MKKKLVTLIACGIFISVHAQTPFFTETFGTALSCDQGNLADGFNSGVGTWTVTNTGTNDPYSNIWYVSSTESGMGIGNCGDGCLGTDLSYNRTLHIGSDPALLPEAGAAYFSFSGAADTYKRAESPTIDASAYYSISLSFNYIMGGVIGSDYMDVYYSPDNGSSWSLLASPPQTNNASCSPQGLWTAYSVALPASANNNANVKIGFRWQNMGSSGADPSVAIDDVVLSGIAGGGPTITTGAITGSPFCAGVNLIVPYTITGTFMGGNVFTAELSDGAGSFASPTNIGSVASTTSGNISCTIPGGTPTGSGYMIRVVSSTPAITGSSSSAFTINALPTATAGNSGPYCQGQTIMLSSGGGVGYTWAGPLSYTSGSQNPSIPSSTMAMSGVYTVTVSDAAGCSATATTNVSVIDCSGIEDENLSTASVYPNPASDLFTISIPDGMVTGSKVSIINMVGEIVYNLTPAQSKTIISSESLGLKSGIYLVQIKHENESRVMRLVIR